MKTKTFFFICCLLTTIQHVSGAGYERYRKLTDTTVFSDHLGFDKGITVTVPIEWQKGTEQRFPLIVVFDRQNERSHQYILNTIDYLTSNEQMPSAVIIGVASDQEHRYRETAFKVSDEKGLALENEKFIFDELIPLAEKQFGASSFRLLIGHSRYGYFTSALLHSRYSQLNAVVSISPFFSQKNVSLTDSIAQLNSRTLTKNLYYIFSDGEDFPADFSRMDSTVKTIKNPFIHAQGSLFPEADHNVTPGLTIGTALYNIFESWSKEQGNYISNEQKELDILASLEKKIRLHYGTPLRFSLGILNGKGWYFYNENMYREAIGAWEILTGHYPNFSEAWLYIIETKKLLKENTVEAEEKFRQSLSKSQMYSLKEKEELMLELKKLKE